MLSLSFQAEFILVVSQGGQAILPDSRHYPTVRHLDNNSQNFKLLERIMVHPV
jgi:hypothetical protein